MGSVHAVYLAVIAVLIVVIVYAAAKALRAGRVLKEVSERFGLDDGVRASLPRREPLRRHRGADLLRARTLDQYRREVDALLERAQSLGEFGPPARLASACQKALLGGKRLRAAILLEVARATSALRRKAHREGRGAGAPDEPSPVDAAEAALFVEYLHAASLAVDDLPEFDDDATRRGRPSLHADPEVGPAVAKMAALALTAAAFQNVCRQLDWVRDHCPEVKNVDRIGTRLIGEVSRALGAAGAAGGQCADIEPARGPGEGPENALDLAYRKTTTFFEIATVCGWLVAGGPTDQVPVLRDAGRLVGTAYQIADDLGDMASDAARAARGKPGWNFANEYGADVARRELERNLRGARYLLTQAGVWTPVWDEIYAQVRKMAEPPVVTPGAESGPSGPGETAEAERSTEAGGSTDLNAAPAAPGDEHPSPASAP
jgi:geranylgeranyl diphosphate synthase type II